MRALATISFSIVASLVLLSGALAQDEDGIEEEQEIAKTPEMWYYQQVLDRYDNPKEAVRRKAEFRSRQRQARIAAMKWYGFSNARPAAAATPFTSMYSPAWQGSRLRPHAWYSTGRPTVVVGPGYWVSR